MNKFRSLIIGAFMTAMTVPVAFAAGTPTINIPANESTQQSITFNNISSDIKNLQVTINLSEEQKSYTFDSNLTNDVGVNIYYEYSDSIPPSITIYITSNVNPLTTSGSLTLGTISANESFNITGVSNFKTTDGTNKIDNLEKLDTQTPSTPPTGDNNNSNDNNDSSNDNNSDDNSNNSSGSTGSGGSSNNNSGNSGSGSSNTSGDNTKPETKPETEPEITELPFTDVNENDWYYNAVKYVYDNGLMSGVSSTNFAPNANTTRGMIVTVLYRLENQPNVIIDNSFDDVKASDYYGNAIYWARQNNIVTGYNSTTFAPNDNITREQMAAILYRYADYKSYSVDKTSDLVEFTDVSQINDYALKPIKWAVSSGLISGMGDGTISPLGNASRAQIATILMRFIENL